MIHHDAAARGGGRAVSLMIYGCGLPAGLWKLLEFGSKIKKK
jgi:hypothetical protein